MIDVRERYGKKYKVTKCETGEGGCHEIVGKRGYVRAYGDALEMYLTSSVLSGRAERQPGFKAVNHYDDASAFVFGPENIVLACKWIKARNRKRFSPEQLARMTARMRFFHKKPQQQDTSGALTSKT